MNTVQQVEALLFFLKNKAKGAVADLAAEHPEWTDNQLYQAFQAKAVGALDGVSPTMVLAAAMQGFHEIRSGASGYDPDAGGVS